MTAYAMLMTYLVGLTCGIICTVALANYLDERAAKKMLIKEDPEQDLSEFEANILDYDTVV